MQSDKCPGNDGLKKEFYETFWNKLKEIFVYSVSQTKKKGDLSASQRQAIIKVIEKKDRDKTFKTGDHIGESGRLISDIIETAKIENKKFSSYNRY